MLSTALTINSASHGNTTVLEHILSHEECDVDPINRLERATPLHLAVRIEDQELRVEVFESLLDAGADFKYVFLSRRRNVQKLTTPLCRIKDKNNETVLDLLDDTERDIEIRKLIRKAQAQASVAHEDVASGTKPLTKYDSLTNILFPDDDGEPGSGSDSE